MRNSEKLLHELKDEIFRVAKVGIYEVDSLTPYIEQLKTHGFYKCSELVENFVETKDFGVFVKLNLLVEELRFELYE